MQKNKKIRTGIVVSDKMNKTVVVTVERVFRHPLYGKIIKRKKKYMVHDEKNQCKIGDSVKIIETKPISKFKRWHMIEIIKKGS